MEGVEQRRQQQRKLFTIIGILAFIITIINMLANAYVYNEKNDVLSSEINNNSKLTIRAINISHDYILRLFTYYMYQVQKNINETTNIIANHSSLNSQRN